MLIVRSLETQDYSIISDLVTALHQKAEENLSHRSGEFNGGVSLPRKKPTHMKLVPIKAKSGSRLSDYSPNVHDRSFDSKHNVAEDVVDFEKFAGDIEPA